MKTKIFTQRNFGRIMVLLATLTINANAGDIINLDEITAREEATKVGINLDNLPAETEGNIGLDKLATCGQPKIGDIVLVKDTYTRLQFSKLDCFENTLGKFLCQADYSYRFYLKCRFSKSGKTKYWEISKRKLKLIPLD
jgi:hypothetical protein